MTMKNDMVTIKNLVQKFLEEKGLTAGTDGEGESCPSELYPSIDCENVSKIEM